MKMDAYSNKCNCDRPLSLRYRWCRSCFYNKFPCQTCGIFTNRLCGGNCVKCDMSGEFWLALDDYHYHDAPGYLGYC